MQGPVVLVTGGARRIGRAIVEDLSAHGWRVIVHANTSIDEAKSLALALREVGHQAAAISGDLMSPGGAEAVFEASCNAFGVPDVIVNNASVFHDDSAAVFDEASFDRHFAIHVKAPIALTAALARRLPAGQEGLVVNMVDQRVWAPNPRFFTYALSKSALWHATRTMAQAHAPRIRVNAIAPGPAFPSERQSESDFRQQIDRLIMKRGPAPGEFGATIRYLWDMKSVTGQMIALDGGQHLAWETPDIAGIRE